MIFHRNGAVITLVPNGKQIFLWILREFGQLKQIERAISRSDSLETFRLRSIKVRQRAAAYITFRLFTNLYIAYFFRMKFVFLLCLFGLVAVAFAQVEVQRWLFPSPLIFCQSVVQRLQDLDISAPSTDDEADISSLTENVRDLYHYLLDCAIFYQRYRQSDLNDEAISFVSKLHVEKSIIMMYI